MRFLSLPSVFGLALAAAVAAGQAPPEDSRVRELLVESIDVEVVDLAVVVSDPDGRRVTGLSRDEFELFVDGEETAITDFLAFDRGAPGRSIASGRASNEPGQPLYLVLYVDNLNLEPITRNRALRAVGRWVDGRLPDDAEVMVVTCDHSLQVRVPFSADHHRVREALLGIESLEGMAVHSDSDRRALLTMVGEADDAPSVLGRARTHAESIFNDVTFTIRALRDLIDTLGGLPGRKVLLHLSNGLPMRAAEDIFHAIDERFPGSSALLEMHRFDLSRDFQMLTADANARGVTIYTLDAEGQRTEASLDGGELSSGQEDGAPPANHVDPVHFSNLRSSLHFLAQETGGWPIVDSDLDAGLALVAEDLSHYYSVGFRPDDPESGRYHRVQVGLRDGPGLVTRHRGGYRDLPVAVRMTDLTRAALHHGPQFAGSRSDGFSTNPAGIEIAVLGSELQAGGEYLVDVAVSIPIGELTFVREAQMHRGRARLFIGAKDAEGGLAPIQEVAVPIDIPNEHFESARNQSYRYTMRLLMRPGRQVIAVGVRDEVGATSSVATLGVEVG